MKIGDRMRSVRLKQDMTIKKTSELIGIAYSTYVNYENNNREPSFQTIQNIAKVLNVSSSYLMGDESYYKTYTKDEWFNNLKEFIIDYAKTHPNDWKAKQFSESIIKANNKITYAQVSSVNSFMENINEARGLLSILSTLGKEDFPFNEFDLYNTIKDYTIYNLDSPLQEHYYFDILEYVKEQISMKVLSIIQKQALEAAKEAQDYMENNK